MQSIVKQSWELMGEKQHRGPIICGAVLLCWARITVIGGEIRMRENWSNLSAASLFAAHLETGWGVRLVCVSKAAFVQVINHAVNFIRKNLKFSVAGIDSCVNGSWHIHCNDRLTAAAAICDYSPSQRLPGVIVAGHTQSASSHYHCHDHCCSHVLRSHSPRVLTVHSDSFLAVWIEISLKIELNCIWALQTDNAI